MIIIKYRSTSPTTLRGVGSNEESSNMENNFTVIYSIQFHFI